MSWRFFRAAAFLWISPFRAERSSSWMARALSPSAASGAAALFNAVRSEERWARLRTVAARAFRMFFLADAIFGTKDSAPEISDVKRSMKTAKARSAPGGCQGVALL